MDWFKLPWGNSYLMGEPQIDQQHQELFKLFGQLSQAVRQGEPPANLAQRLQDLQTAMVAHFHHEEGLMGQFNYPGAAFHTNRHGEILQELAALLHIFQETDAEDVRRAVPRELSHFLKKWLQDHIREMDRPLCAFLMDQPSP